MPVSNRSKIARAKVNARPPRRIQPDDLLKLQLVSDPQIAPDGRHIVFVKKQAGEKNQYVSNLWLVDAEGRSAPRPFTNGGKDGHPRWSPDGSRLAFTSGRDKPKQQIWTISAQGGEATPLTRFPEGSLGDFKWSPGGRWIAASFREQDADWTQTAKQRRQEKGLSDPPRVLDDLWYRLDGDGYFNSQRHHLYLIDAASGAHLRIYSKDTLGQFSFDFSPDGKQIVLATNRDRFALTRPWKTELLRLNLATGKTTVIPNLPVGPKESVLWSPDGRWIAFAGRVGRDGMYSTENAELWICDPVKGHGRCLTGKEDYCLMAVPATDTADVFFGAVLQWSPDSRRVYAQIGWHGESHLASVAVRGGKLQFHTAGAKMYSLGNLNGKGSIKVALTAGDALMPNEVHVGELVSGKIRARKLSSFNAPLIKSLTLSKPESHWIRSADGTPVQVWSIKPPHDKPGRKYPAVLEIHGGPHAMYAVGFFHEFQVLAARGCAVFFSNPRGSKGYGRNHCAAIRGKWGAADWSDIQAVTEFMKKQAFVDAKRLGIMGGSYGGYMTNWAIGHSRDFKAAITDRCVSNIVSLLGTSDFTEPPDHYWPGNTWDRTEELWNQSPLKYLGQCKTPTLIIHSEGDLRCSIEQGEQVFTALKLNRVPARFVRYPRSASHGLSRSGPPDLRLHRLKQILAWWKRWLG